MTGLYNFTSLIAVALTSIYANMALGNVSAPDFDARFIIENTHGGVTDLASFASMTSTPPGKYNVDIYVNQRAIGTEVVEFVQGPIEHELIPCFSRDKWLSLGLNESALAAKEGGLMDADSTCISNAQLFGLLDVSLSLEKAKLEIGIPQAYMSRQVSGYVNPDLWDDGITAATVGYSFSGSKDEQGDNIYLYLNNGFNIGVWRFRNTSTFSYYDAGGVKDWNAISTYAERSLKSIQSNLKVGQYYSQDTLFQSGAVKGIQLSTDERMLPDSMAGFAPSIRGIAKSYAEVLISQNGNIIYRTFVAPGPFNIDDLYPTASSGDLEVTVREADGSMVKFIQPYSSLPIMQREGAFRYELNLGAQEDVPGNPYLFQGSLAWGGTSNTTFYGGSQFTDYYKSLAVGIGRNLGPIGAISMDVTHAITNDYFGERRNGNSIRFLYAKSMNELGTNFNLFGYRYSTHGFFTLPEANIVRMAQESLSLANSYMKFPAKGEIQATISQRIGQSSSLYLSSNFKNYWDTDKKTHNIYAGFSSSINAISYGVTYSATESFYNDNTDHILSLNISAPLNLFVRALSDIENPIYSNYMVSTDLDGGVRHSASVAGSAMADDRLNYSITQGYSQQERYYNGGVFASYRGSKTKAELGVNYDKDETRVNYGLSGGAIFHEDGMTLTPEISHTNILVKAPGAAGVELENGAGIKTDDAGFAVQPYASDFRENRVALKVDSLDANTEVSEPVKQVVPTRGAVVRAEFNAAVGYRAVLVLQRAEGIPFGAVATLRDGDSEGIVAEEGVVFLSGLPATGTVDVSWGTQAHQRCRADYKIDTQGMAGELVNVRTVCN
ncbi:outer membrane usher protein [Aeromonas hydrophila]|uniref:fimbria/pilus outer membrane usher protein n=1 Tax=Aeromonas hydrophila TaxID=644 RepID=UPI00216847E5|nr:fimbria/pilus outer membrane usher protein [Aeromonas hydrophila]MCS3770601.1 outer membrane usher protein [Aeromonas hydrophila]MCS3794041.1 outer membrane usher protein [Aeromonas hydrophila]